MCVCGVSLKSQRKNRKRNKRFKMHKIKGFLTINNLFNTKFEKKF